MRKTVCLFLALIQAGLIYAITPELDSLFRMPPQEAKPIMIWQWMDGVVSAEGITCDLEAYRDAGIGGVQQFQVGGKLQGVIRDTTNAMGVSRGSISCAMLSKNVPDWGCHSVHITARDGRRVPRQKLSQKIPCKNLYGLTLSRMAARR